MTLRRKLALIAALYFVEGFPMGVYRDVWQALYFTEAGFSKTAVGVASGFGLAWSLKVLWSPLVDRFGDWRHWIAGALTAMAAVLALVPGLGSGEALWFAVAVFCLASATQDIALDAYSVPLTERGEEGPLNAARTSAYRIGRLALGAGLPLLATAAGWASAHRVAAVFAAVAALLVLFAPRPALVPKLRRDWRGMLRSWARPGLAHALGFLVLHRLGDFALAPMVGPFWIERGFTRAEFASLSTFAGVWAGISGAVFAAWFVARATLERALAIGLALAVASNLAYAGAALSGSPAAVVAAGVCESLCSGAAGVAFMALLVRACERSHAAVQYAALTAFYPLSGSLVGMLSGATVERIGFAGYFALTASFALPSLLLIPMAVRWADAGSPARS